MSKFVKELIQQEYEKAFEGTRSFVVVSTKGITGNQNNEMRGELSKKDIKLAVVKNSLMRRALTKLDLAAASSLFMAGPCTICYGGDSAVDIAKELVDWAKKLKVMELKGAFIEGTIMEGEEGVKDLSKMPTRAELQGQIVTLALSPGRKVAGAIAGPGGLVAGCIKGLVEKLEDEAA